MHGPLSFQSGVITRFVFCDGSVHYMRVKMHPEWLLALTCDTKQCVVYYNALMGGACGDFVTGCAARWPGFKVSKHKDKHSGILTG